MTRRIAPVAVLILAACGARDGAGEPAPAPTTPPVAGPSAGATAEEAGPAAEEEGGPSGLAIRNASEVAICAVHVSPTAHDTWGGNRLEAGDRLEPGETQGWRLAPGAYDLRLTDCEGGTLLDQRDVRVEGQGILFTYQSP